MTTFSLDMREVKAPWTQEEVRNLNLAQKNPYLHAFTCAHRGKSFHQDYGIDEGALLATADGWVCRDCPYTQDWAYAFMLKGAANSWDDWNPFT